MNRGTRRAPSRGRFVGRLLRAGLTAAVGAGCGASLSDALAGTRAHDLPGGAHRWSRTNHAGRTVSLLEGPVLICAGAFALAAPTGPARVRTAALVALLGAGAAGWYDDARETSAKGLAGHLGALRHGELTAGVVKIAVLTSTGVAAGGLAGRGGALHRVAAGAVVAGAANVVNLLDLRPGRALKTALALAIPLAVRGGPGAGVAAAAAGAGAAVLPADLSARSMLGDAGANALGALVGVALVADAGPRRVLGSLAAVGGLTLASEIVSFSRVIDAVPPLRWLDALGRPPAVPERNQEDDG